MIYLLIPLLVAYLLYSYYQINKNWKNIRKTRGILSLRFSSIFILSSLIPNIIIGSSATLLVKYYINSVFNEDIAIMIENINYLGKQYNHHLNQNTKSNMSESGSEMKEENLINRREILHNKLCKNNTKYNFHSSAFVKRTNDTIELVTSSNCKKPLSIPQSLFDQLDHTAEGKVIFIENINGYILGASNINGQYYIMLMKNHIDELDSIMTRVEKYKSLYRKSSMWMEVLIYGIYAIVILMCIVSIICGIVIARKLIIPFDSLISYTRDNKSWKYAYPELAIFIKQFQIMINKLHVQNYKLIDSNQQLTRRNNIIENIFQLSPIGIVILDQNQIQMTNDMAAILIASIKEPFDQFVRSNDTITSIPINHHEIRLSRAENIIILEDMKEFLRYKKSELLSKVAKQVAHEIKNPLTPIRLAIDILKKGMNIECINIIDRNILHIQSLVEAFREFASFPKPKFILCNIIAIIDHIKSYNQLLEQCVLKINNDCAEELLLLLDDQMIERALLNLVKNSIEAQASEITIDITCRSDIIEIIFHDNGIGFKNTHNPAKLYYTTKENGTGIGLAIVENTIHQHGGTLDYKESMIYTHGASVIIQLPNAKKSISH